MPVSYSQSVATEVRVQLTRQRLTQAQLAEKAGMTARYLQYRLSGRAPLSTDDLEKISGALGIPLQTLVCPVA